MKSACIWVLARVLGCCSTPIWFPTIKRRPNVHRHASLFFRFFQTDKNLSLTMIIYSLLFFPIKLFFLYFFFLSFFLFSSFFLFMCNFVPIFSISKSIVDAFVRKITTKKTYRKNIVLKVNRLGQQLHGDISSSIGPVIPVDSLRLRSDEIYTIKHEWLQSGFNDCGHGDWPQSCCNIRSWREINYNQINHLFDKIIGKQYPSKRTNWQCGFASKRIENMYW